ncbi:polysaccharide biosynthesis/export family protein [Flavobacterium sp. 14A]|uniref:polysaccharide biosynthesis/export family protein n=1 Tax=Flavobacterium sp. 14A TaxID=2735896 RepID=UPI00156E8B88|nr:polysaccharide biosynthesis/export family protein [Flavobacterium sp. 14A]NRT13286.1 polysaccharide export outer membrane protein [Flavobacterium sp. 14A]
MKCSPLINKVLVVVLAVLFFSCASRQEVVYYQNSAELTQLETAMSYEVKIQPDDLLSIIVSAEDQEIAAPFNLKSIRMASTSNVSAASGQESMQLYLVDAKGAIDFPVLGKLQVGGLSRTEVLRMFKEKIGLYIKNPIINFRIANFKVSVQGEVNAPGSYTINSERITLIEALALGKDLTIYGKRDNLLIIREVNGVKSFNRVDITKADFINSPFYYLAQNDVVYVEPNKTRTNASAVGPNTGVLISITSLLITLVTLILR